MNETTSITPETMSQAVNAYLSRQSRTTHPQGKFDSAGRFSLAESERSECCRYIRTPSRHWPYSEMLHGRTMEHIAHLYGVDVTELRRAVNQARKVERLAKAA